MSQDVLIIWIDGRLYVVQNHLSAVEARVDRPSFIGAHKTTPGAQCPGANPLRP
jgi:hypothetical protein